jgi:hypothetical protein
MTLAPWRGSLRISIPLAVGLQMDHRSVLRFLWLLQRASFLIMMRLSKEIFRIPTLLS